MERETNRRDSFCKCAADNSYWNDKRGSKIAKKREKRKGNGKLLLHLMLSGGVKKTKTRVIHILFRVPFQTSYAKTCRVALVAELSSSVVAGQKTLTVFLGGKKVIHPRPACVPACLPCGKRSRRSVYVRSVYVSKFGHLKTPPPRKNRQIPQSKHPRRRRS